MRDPSARAIAVSLWIFLGLAVFTVALMTWHPWVIGAHAGCPPAQSRGWDGRCRPA